MGGTRHTSETSWRAGGGARVFWTAIPRNDHTPHPGAPSNPFVGSPARGMGCATGGPPYPPGSCHHGGAFFLVNLFGWMCLWRHSDRTFLESSRSTPHPPRAKEGLPAWRGPLRVRAGRGRVARQNPPLVSFPWRARMLPLVGPGSGRRALESDLVVQRGNEVGWGARVGRVGPEGGRENRRPQAARF